MPSWNGVQQDLARNAPRQEQHVEGKKKRPGDVTRQRGIKRLGDGRYRIRVYVMDPKTGRQKERDRVIEAESMKDAARVRVRLQEEALASLSDEHASTRSRKIGDVATAWLEHKLSAQRVTSEGSRPRLCPTTRLRYEASVKNVIVPMLGAMIVDRLTRSDVERWRDTLGGTYRGSTVNGHLRVLRSVLVEAGNDAAARVSGLAEDDGRITDEEPNLLDKGELGRFLDVASRRFPQHYPLIAVMFTTSMRISTALALRREDFDPQLGLVRVRRRRSGAEVIEGVKRSRTGMDRPSLVKWVWAAVQDEWARMTEVQVASGLAFPSASGGYRARSCLDKPFRDICKDAGIAKRFTPHGCRRTSADLIRRVAGERMSMAVAGHTTTEMHRHYTRVDAAEQLEAIEHTFGHLRLVKSETGDQTGEGAKVDGCGPSGAVTNVAS